jgi:hypothetical protein
MNTYSTLFFVIVTILALSVNAVTQAKKSAMSRPQFLKKVSSATKDSFAKDIVNTETENFILTTAGSRLYETYRTRIRRKGKELGINVPSAWARKPFPVKEPEPVEEEAAAEEAPAAAE